MKTVHAAFTLAALALVTIQAPPARAQTIYIDQYAAIAYSESTGNCGWAWDSSFRGLTEQAALKSCNASDAEVVACVQGGWAVLVIAEDKCFAAVIGQDDSWKPLYEQALKDLRKHTTKKATRAIVVCSGRFTPLDFTPPAYQVGDKVRASRDGQWYDALVLDRKAGLYQITYDGHGTKWDEWVGEDRLADKPAVAKYKAGQEVRAEWKGQWYDAHVLEVKDGQYKISYTGYGKEWDEWVGDDRLKAP